MLISLNVAASDLAAGLIQFINALLLDARRYPVSNFLRASPPFRGLFRNLGAESVIWNSSKTQSGLFVLCWSGDGASPKPFAIRFARSQHSCVGVYFG